MQRRQFMAGLAGGALSARALAAAKTNFVFILADDFGWRDLGCYGNQYYSTPNIDRLAAEGARFTNAYAACPVCSPQATCRITSTARPSLAQAPAAWLRSMPSAISNRSTAPDTGTPMHAASRKQHGQAFHLDFNALTQGGCARAVAR